jgi:hypothetical protein
MNDLPMNEIVVLDVAGSRAKIFTAQWGSESVLTRLGFVLVDGYFERPIIDMDDREKLVRSLIELRAIFVDGRDWSPTEVVDYLREQGKVDLACRRITWLSPTEYLISEH